MKQEQLNNLLKSCPSNWKQITVEQFQELNEIELTEFESMFDKDVERISILADIDINEVEDMTATQLMKFRPVLEFIRTEPSKKFKTLFQFEDLILNYVGLNSLTLAEFIELDSFYTDNIIKNLHLVAGLLFRQRGVDSWNVPTVEPYNFDIQERGQHFLSVPVSDVYGIALEFVQYHKNFQDNYKGLFNDPLTEEEKEAPEDETPEERKARRDAIQEEKLQSKWGWERAIFELSNGDLTKYDAILQTHHILTFNLLSMKKELRV